MSNFPPVKVFHIAVNNEWQQALENGLYSTGSLDSEGFIHFSTEDQLLQTANKYYISRTDLVLLVVDTTLFTSELKYDPVGEQMFPHLYGPLNLEAVQQVLPFKPQPNGMFAWPEALPKNEE